MDLSKATVAVEGYGNAGYHAAVLCKELFGSKIVGMCDSKGGIYNKAGIDPQVAQKHKIQTGSVSNLPDTESMPRDEILELKVDILIPAAIENVITEDNAKNIKAKVVAELANGPTTPEADDILQFNGIHLIPDFLCNAGGVTVSYVEMVQNSYMFAWQEDAVHRLLDRKMTLAYQSVVDTSTRYNISMRDAAYVLAVGRVVEVMKLRGWV